MGINPLRIDELEHFDNIDQRILTEIEKSDFMVADLTYERPSVYFEAGYAERKPMPVIYTCRADHFSPTGPESSRIHFDIRQRPIVKWVNPDDSTFEARLKRRVTRAIMPLVKHRKEDLQSQEEEAHFGRLSLGARSTQLIAAGKKLANGLGFRAVVEKNQQRKESGWLGYRTSGTAIRRLLILASPCTKTDLVRVKGWASVILGKIPTPAIVSKEMDRIVLLCLGSVPTSRVESVFHDFTRRDQRLVRTWRKREQNCLLTIHLIDKIRSVTQFEDALRAAIE
jgi:hypothetical protein